MNVMKIYISKNENIYFYMAECNENLTKSFQTLFLTF